MSGGTASVTVMVAVWVWPTSWTAVGGARTITASVAATSQGRPEGFQACLSSRSQILARKNAPELGLAVALACIASRSRPL